MPGLAGGDAAAVIADPPARLRLVRVRVPLRRAHAAAHGEEVRRDVVLVEWTSAVGSTGWGECPTLGHEAYATESTERAWTALVTDLGPAAMAGRAPLLGGAVAAAGALADARLDAALVAEGASLATHLGGTRRALARTQVLADPAAPAHDLVRLASAASAGGAAMVKVKVDPRTDPAAVAAVVHAVPELGVAVDANGTAEDPALLSALDGLGLAYIEQPFPPEWTWDEVAAARAGLRTPVCLDEPLRSAEAVRSAVAAGACDVVSVKPARMGGVEQAAEAVRTARRGGARAFVGGMLELAVGRATAAAVASLAGCDLPTDLGPSSQYVERDVAEPVELDGAGHLMVPAGAGCGRVPDPARLAEVAVDQVVLTA